MNRETVADATLIYMKIVERYTPFFERPEDRLRFLSNTFVRQAERERQVRCTLRYLALVERTLLYRWLFSLMLHRLIFEELRRSRRALFEQGERLAEEIKVPFAARMFFYLYQARHVCYSAGLVVVAAALVIGFYPLRAWSGTLWFTQSANAFASQNDQPHTRGASRASEGETTLAAAGVKYLPGYQAERIWLVEQKGAYERYSNGLRILTDYETDNHPRAYYSFPRGAGTTQTSIHYEPTAILYHASESDLLPFTVDNNDSIKPRTSALLNYVKTVQIKVL